ncbi:hypothetical protein J3R83DRAFT_5283 [Lanmaoa asiatica]|nr:hypothetical protein J3R83DRAFT_5283 [Lanmaoa asiatica]
MSKLPLVPIFSAAHVSKWDTLPEDTLIRITQSRFELERTTRLSVSDDHDNDAYAPSESSESDGRVLSTRECEITVQVAPAHRVRFGRPSSKSRENMAVKTYTWITLWFLLTAPVIFWDAMYCFVRPRSMVGGDLHWIWEPYGIYQDIDYVYGIKALEENNGFTNAQCKPFIVRFLYITPLIFLHTALLNLVETALNLTYVYLAHVSSWSGAPLLGFAAVTMTLSKTVLYWAQEYYCGLCAVGHNAWGDLLLYWVLPNGLWLVFPSMIAWRLGGDIINSLSAASQSARRAASGKMQ